MSETDIDLNFVDSIVKRIGGESDKAIPILQAIQEECHYLPEPALRRVCEITAITPAQIDGVASFYSHFRRRPAGQHTIRICVGTACHVKGAGAVHDAIRRELKIPPGDDTDPDRAFTVVPVACLGCCTLAPVMQIDGITYGHVSPDVVSDMLAEFRELSRQSNGVVASAVAAPRAVTGEIRVGLGSCCVARGSRDVFDALSEAVRATGVDAAIKHVGCVGMCHQTPLVEVETAAGSHAMYARVLPDDATAIVRRHFRPAKLSRRLAGSWANALENILTDETPESAFAVDRTDEAVAAFLGKQKRLATEYSGCLDPLDLAEYREHGGFEALERCLRDPSPGAIVDQILESGLRGRGGAGYPTGTKWRRVAEASSAEKYVIANGDEGDPGAFMDRMILESYPYRVIEGMIIAAFAVGAQEGMFYIREEYPLAVQRVEEALQQCRRNNLLGAGIMGSSFGLQIRVVRGAGAFVCGEETALIASVEGGRGMPRLRPPFPADKGLRGKPTLINNVETLALVPWVIRHGAPAFAAIGADKSRGTKVFALTGKIQRTGLIEVPMGISIREIVEEIGGGIADGHRLKAVQIGGPSGGCIPAHLADTPVNYESLTGAGAMMGSGGLVVLDETDCMVEIARYFLAFTQGQSCGKCTFCRIGTRRMLEILERIVAGKGQTNDLDELARLAKGVQQGSLCGLGRTAPNPVLTTLRYFRDEYEAHLAGRCPAKKCAALISYRITEKCIGCTLCAQHCPVDAIPMKPYEQHEIQQDKCTKCGTCLKVCRSEAVEIRSPAQ